jgi:hypothetical protein
VRLNFHVPLSARPSKSSTLLAVNVQSTPQLDLEIVSCNSGRQKSLNDLVDKLCQGTYGKNTPDLTCSQVVSFLQRITALAICKDVYGDTSRMQMRGPQKQYCDLSEIHKNKTCPTNKILAGFDDKGGLICRDIPDPAAAMCLTWSEFGPDSRGTCPQQVVLQTRTCMFPVGLVMTESRVVSGTRSVSCEVHTWCRPPGSWMSDNHLRCIVDDPNEMMKGGEDEVHTATGRFGPYTTSEGTFENTGSVTYKCSDSEAQIISSTCVKAPAVVTP